jgi:hypothetical protein
MADMAPQRQAAYEAIITKVLEKRERRGRKPDDERKARVVLDSLITEYGARMILGAKPHG